MFYHLVRYDGYEQTAAKSDEHIINIGITNLMKPFEKS